VCPSSMFRYLFIRIRKTLEALEIQGKSESPSPSRKLKIQSKKEKDSKFI
jgi:hypothetical protein